MSADAHALEIRREARVAGLASDTPSLTAVEGRRLQLWGLLTGVLLAVAGAIVLSFGNDLTRLFTIPPGVVRASVIALGLGFAAYTVEKELHLRRLTALLVEEQVHNVALRAEVDRLLEIERVRSDLLSAVSHDLKTPLTTMLGSAVLLRRELPAEQRGTLTTAIEREGRHLERLIDELLDAAALEREGPPLELQTVNLANLVRTVIGDLALAGKGAEVEAPAEEHVRAGAEGLRRILTSLIDNAHVHGDPPVKVIVRRQGEEVVLSVRDSGQGIPPQDRRRVFELFTRLDSSRTAPGLGLGLAIVPGLVAAWGGRVWLDDAPEGGAAFHIAFPRSG